MERTNRKMNGAARTIAALACLAWVAPHALAQGAPAPGNGTAKDAPSVASVATVASKDGTKIAFEKSGEGPALILVAGALSGRGDAARLAALLAPSFTVIDYDRRGRGQSGDAERYAVEREIEDIEAVIGAVGGAAFLFGHSSGAALALEAANVLGGKVKAVALFEPPYIVDESRPPIPAGLFDEIGALVAAGRRGDAVAKFMTVGIGVPEEMLAQMRASPMWAGMEELAHTLPYDGAIVAGLQSGKPLPAKRWKSVAARVLILDGERSDPFLRNAATALGKVLPLAERRTIPDQDHAIVFRAPEVLAPVLAEYFAAPEPAAAKKERR